nr:histidine phosphatase family protein [Klebsiella pneumoniae]
MQETTLTSLNASLLKLNITILSYTCSCFFRREPSTFLHIGGKWGAFQTTYMAFNDASNTGSTRGNKWNVKGIIQGHSDMTLRGSVKQQHAGSVCSDYRVECVYASPLGRAANGTAWRRFSLFTIAEPALKNRLWWFEGMTTIELLQNNQTPEALFNLDAEYCPPEG